MVMMIILLILYKYTFSVGGSCDTLRELRRDQCEVDWQMPSLLFESHGGGGDTDDDDGDDDY